MKLTLASLKEN